MVFVPYHKPGVPLTGAIAARLKADTQVIVLENHGLVCAGDTVDEVAALIKEVETRLEMPVLVPAGEAPVQAAPQGYAWLSEATPLATNARLRALALAGSYYPDHVVFLGAALPTHPDAPAFLTQEGAALRADATSSQRAMLHCLMDELSRLPQAWTPHAIGAAAEAELLNWDAEKYRQALAEKTTP